MHLAEPDKPTIDPALFLVEHGRDCFADLLRERAGYVPQLRPLNAFVEAMESGKPLLAEGDRGCGKTAFGEAVALACNMPFFYLQCIDGLEIDDVLFTWDESEQERVEREALEDGMSRGDARALRWTVRCLLMGEFLAAFHYAATTHERRPMLHLDEVDKFKHSLQNMLLQPLARGYGDVPRLKPDSRVGVTNPEARLPVIFLTSNNLDYGVSPPLRSRCLYTWFNNPTPAEEMRILREQVPVASPALLAATVKMIRYIRGMGSVADKPSLRESISFMESAARKRFNTVNAALVERQISHLARNKDDQTNILRAGAAIENIVAAKDAEVERQVNAAASATSSTLQAA